MKVKQRKRSSTVPNTPKHKNDCSSSISNNTSITNTSNLNNNINIITEVNNDNNNNNNNIRSGAFYWESFSAPHFMLPTFAINCRSLKHTERCPRACKGKKY